MLGSEPIIWDESIGICVQSDVADEVPERLRRSPVEPAAMHVNNRGPLSGLRRRSPPTEHPSNGRGSKSHALWDRDLLHDAVERTAAAVPSIWPFICATTDRKAATPTESSWLTGCITNQGAPAPVLFRMLDCLFSTLKSHFAKDGIGAEKDLTHCLQESRAFPNRLTQSSARSVVCSLWPDPDVDTENPFHTELV